MKQLHFIDTFDQNHYNKLTEYQKKDILESHMFLKENRYGTIKCVTVSGGNKKRELITKE